MERPALIARFRSLLQHQQKLREAALTRTIGPEKYGQWSEPDRPTIFPGLKVLYSKSREHSSLPESGRFRLASNFTANEVVRRACARESISKSNASGA
jgi:hypothetical protein